eukprot:scaffold196267_cov32-Tisochrysis_lutea.AAC.5
MAGCEAEAFAYHFKVIVPGCACIAARAKRSPTTNALRTFCLAQYAFKVSAVFLAPLHTAY